MITVNQAVTIIKSTVVQLKTEYINVENAINRILATDIKSKADSPPFDMSSMDGYAVKINKNLNLNYEFSVNHDLDEFQYNAFGTTFSKNNFVTTFNYVEENGVIGSTNILENKTTFNFDEQNFITFRTRENRKIDLTEYYDLIYEYRNDCLTAGIKYNKTYYKDRDLEPTEDFMFSIKLVPLSGIEQKFAN